MDVAITGSSGLIGSALQERLRSAGDRVVPVVRRPPGPDEVEWDPASHRLDAQGLEGLDGVVHLAGERIDQRWTAPRRQRMADSRIQGTRLMAETLAALDRPPKVLVSASAVGYYGDRGDEVLHEDNPPGKGFLADLCQSWEAAADPAREAGIRVVHSRTGIVLSARGGALARMLPVFRMGLGGRIGSGRQWMSWISEDDIAGLLHHMLTDEGLEGPVNACSPEPVTNRTYTKALGKALSRPTLAIVPGLALKAVYGQMAEEMLLVSQRASASKAEAAGFRWQHPEVEGALRHVLGRVNPS